MTKKSFAKILLSPELWAMRYALQCNGEGIADNSMKNNWQDEKDINFKIISIAYCSDVFGVVLRVAIRYWGEGGRSVTHWFLCY